VTEALDCLPRAERIRIMGKSTRAFYED
jgi:hypothetical protein